MHSNRRDFIGAVGAGAIALGLSSSAVGQAAGGGQGNRRMIIRVDDVGQSKVCNIGTFEAIEHGFATSADVMLDSPGTEDALERLRHFPWISVGWHMHMWGAPVSPVAQVPSLVEKGGEFDGRFRLDLARAQDVVYDEALRELRAQLTRCARILGRVPDTANGGNDASPWGKAVKAVVNEFAIANNFSGGEGSNPVYLKKVHDAKARGEGWAEFYSDKPFPASKPDPKWADRKIISPAGTTAFIDLLTDSVSSVEKNYDPVLFYTQDRSGILKYPKDVVTWQAWHPGYVDYYVYRLGERVNRARAQQFVIGRTQDVAALTDRRLADWIKQNRIELINFRDALYGRQEYQNHLRAVGSDLYMA